MASNNIDESAMLKHVVFCLYIWDIDYISKDTLKKAKDGAPECCGPLTRLLFDLSLLDSFNFEYTLSELGIRLVSEDSECFMQEFVLASLSESHCPLLQYHEQTAQDQHCLAFDNSRLLLIIVGWLMSKIEFFATIKSKLINKMFTNLYIEKRNQAGQKQKPIATKKRNSINDKNQSSSNCEMIQRLYRGLEQRQFRIDCLARKKSQILARLTKELTAYNKKNGTNVKMESILIDSSMDMNDAWEQKTEMKLEAILSECNKSMKNQQYFWMWLQFKVIQGEYKCLQEQFADQYEKVEGRPSQSTRRVNPEYLNMYNQQFRKVTSKLNEINEHMESMGSLLNSIKNPKNQIGLMKETLEDTDRMLHEHPPDLVEQLGTPCFLKLQVLRYSEQFGYNKRPKKGKKPKQAKKSYFNNDNEGGDALKSQIRQFIDSLQQLKFL